MTHLVLRALTVATALSCQVPTASTRAPHFDVPSTFAAVTPLVRTLEAAGLVIQRMEDGQQERLFPNLRASVFIETDRGDIKAAVFASDVRAEQISIRYSRNARRGIHEYRLDGIGPPRTGITLTSGVPLYFTIDRGWLVETRDGAMDLIVKRALGQISDEPQRTGRVPR